MTMYRRMHSIYIYIHVYKFACSVLLTFRWCISRKNGSLWQPDRVTSCCHGYSIVLTHVAARPELRHRFSNAFSMFSLRQHFQNSPFQRCFPGFGEEGLREERKKEREWESEWKREKDLPRMLIQDVRNKVERPF